MLSKDLETNEKTAVAIQRRGKYDSITIELLLKAVFYTLSTQRGFNEDNWGDPISCPVWRRGGIPPP
jgi:hypothetical protein